MYLGRIRQGEWLRIYQPKTSAPGRGAPSEVSYPLPDVPDWTGETEFIEGVNNPTLTVIDHDGNKVVDSKRMHLLDSQINNCLFVADLYIGDDIPVGVCTARTEYESLWHKQSLMPTTSQSKLQVYATLSTFEVVPSGSGKGTYQTAFMYERPQATFLLGQHDDGSLDFRRNPRE